MRYIGLFSAIELVKDKETKEPLVPYGKDPEGVMGKIGGMLKERKFMTYTHENMIIVAPPLIITEEQLDGRNGQAGRSAGHRGRKIHLREVMNMAINLSLPGHTVTRQTTHWHPANRS